MCRRKWRERALVYEASSRRAIAIPWSRVNTANPCIGHDHVQLDRARDIAHVLPLERSALTNKLPSDRQYNRVAATRDRWRPHPLLLLARKQHHDPRATHLSPVPDHNRLRTLRGRAQAMDQRHQSCSKKNLVVTVHPGTRYEQERCASNGKETVEKVSRRASGEGVEIGRERRWGWSGEERQE